jgi:signal transduction histidine kinase
VTERGKIRLAKVLFALVLVEFGISLILAIFLAALPEYSFREAFQLGDLGFILGVLMFPILGVVLATRRPENAIGWLMLVIGLVAVEPLTAYGDYALAADLPGAEWALSFVQWTWVPVIGLAGTFVLLLFPDGHLPSPRWRWFAWAIAVGMTLASLGILLSPGTLADSGYPEVENMFGVQVLEPVLAVAWVGIFSIPIGILGSAISLRVRYRRSGPTERLQIRWLASAASIVAVLFGVTMLLSAIASTGEWAIEGDRWLVILQALAVMSFALIPLSIGVAVLRYRLYDIDVVIRKAVVAAMIAVFFTAVYALVVGGIGALVQSYSTTTLSFLAAALVALLFQPVLARSRKLATRIVYGKRATPYEVLSEFSEHVGGTYSDEDVLPRMARVVGEGVGASSSCVWLERGGRLHVAASWGEGEAIALPPISVQGVDLPEMPEADAAFPVEDQGELLGALTVAMLASDPMDEAKAKLVSDLAAQAGLVLRNVRLTEELRERLVDLQASQKRLVTAQDEERRKIERNIHDGAQQQLVALTVKMRLAQSLAARDAAKTEGLLAQMQEETQAALEDLRDLARGIYPPLLQDQGLAAALESQARKSAVPVGVETDGIGRYPQEVEAAVYFSVLEALQNVAKYAEARSTTVSLSQEDGALAFSVRDDGRGFATDATARGSGLQGIADRLGALGGTVEIASTLGAGTLVAGRIPADPL